MTINLNMQQINDIVIHEGINIVIDEENKEIYNYLLANVLAYYLSKNYINSQIDLMNWDGKLYCNSKVPVGSSIPIRADLKKLLQSDSCRKIVVGLISCYNVEFPFSQIISNVKEKIKNQQLGNELNISILNSYKQYEYINLIKEEDVKVLNFKKVYGQQNDKNKGFNKNI